MEKQTDEQKIAGISYEKIHTSLSETILNINIAGTNAVSIKGKLKEEQVDSLLVMLNDIKSFSSSYADFLVMEPNKPETLPQQLYYIQEKHRTVGNSATWWRKNDQGYSCHLDEAGRYCEEEMVKRTKDVEDVGWPVEDIDKMATLQVDVQKMHHHLANLEICNLKEDTNLNGRDYSGAKVNL